MAAVVDTALYRLFMLVLDALAIGLTVWLLNHSVAATAARDGLLKRAVPPVGWTVLATLALAAASPDKPQLRHRFCALLVLDCDEM